MKLILRYIRDYKRQAVLAPLFKMLEATFELFIPLVIARIIDLGINNKDYKQVELSCLLLVLLAVIGLTSSLTAQYFSADAAVGVSTRLRSELFDKLCHLSMGQVDELGSDTMITRMTSDVNQIQNGVNMSLRLLLRSPFIVFGAMIMAFTIDVKGALVFVVTIPLLTITVYGVMLVTMPLYKRVQSALDKILGRCRENIKGVRVIRAFAIEDEEIASFKEENSDLNTLQKHVGKVAALTGPITFIIVNAATVVLLYTGAVRVDLGILTTGQVVALVNYMSQILVELVKLTNMVVLITKTLASSSRIQAIFDMKEDMIDGSELYDENSQEETAVEFENVSLSYQGGENALSDISFKIKKGQTVGVIGGTGSGKSSLVNLINRAYDTTAGTVYVNGRDVRCYSLDSLRGKIGIVLQKAVLFKGSIRENILWGKEDATDNEVREALIRAQAWDFVKDKEGQLDYQVVQGGKNLSGGQKQRISIARALVRKPEILILDDSSSALDYATDASLRQSIKDMEKENGKQTVFIVSQRTISIQNADVIIVLEDGRVSGIGTHDELLKDCKEYRQIYESQFKNIGRED